MSMFGQRSHQSVVGATRIYSVCVCVCVSVMTSADVSCIPCCEGFFGFQSRSLSPPPLSPLSLPCPKERGKSRSGLAWKNTHNIISLFTVFSSSREGRNISSHIISGMFYLNISTPGMNVYFMSVFIGTRETDKGTLLYFI